MKISQVNTTNNLQSFKGAFKINIPRVAFADKYDEVAAESVFNYTLKRAIAQKPRKIISKILNKLGLVPEALSFTNYPGYEYIKRPVRKNGSTWVEQHLNYRYNLYNDKMESPLEITLPNTSKENFEFFLLTGKEKNKFLAAQPKAIKDAKYFFRESYSTITSAIKRDFQPEDEILLEKIALFSTQIGAFQESINNAIKIFDIKNLDTLKETLSKLLALD